jgi:hypothetical protein
MGADDSRRFEWLRHTFVDFRPCEWPSTSEIVDPEPSCEAVLWGNGPFFHADSAPHWKNIEIPTLRRRIGADVVGSVSSLPRHRRLS